MAYKGSGTPKPMWSEEWGGGWRLWLWRGCRADEFTWLQESLSSVRRKGISFFPAAGAHLEHSSRFGGCLVTQSLPLCLLIKYEWGSIVSLWGRQESKTCCCFYKNTSEPLADLIGVGSTNSREMLLMLLKESPCAEELWYTGTSDWLLTPHNPASRSFWDLCAPSVFFPRGRLRGVQVGVYFGGSDLLEYTPLIGPLPADIWGHVHPQLGRISLRSLQLFILIYVIAHGVTYYFLICFFFCV